MAGGETQYTDYNYLASAKTPETRYQTNMDVTGSCGAVWDEGLGPEDRTARWQDLAKYLDIRLQLAEPPSSVPLPLHSGRHCAALPHAAPSPVCGCASPRAAPQPKRRRTEASPARARDEASAPCR